MSNRCRTHNAECDVEVECSTCNGEGSVEDDEGGVREWVTCWQCKGSGMSPWLECQYCLDEDDYV